MKFKDVKINIRRGDIKRCKVDAVIRGDEKEGEIRRACCRALRGRGSRGKRSIAVIREAQKREGLLPVALAKIIAQEIFRYIRQEKHTFKTIHVILNSQEVLKIFNKVIRGYLEHIIYKVSQGPFVTVDAIIEIAKGVVLIKRSNPPFGWAIPGGFVDCAETLEDAARREAKEETGLIVRNLKQMHTYSQPWRDPRFHTVSTVFVCSAYGKPRASSDAQEATVFSPQEWRRLKLAFDHNRVLEDYLRFKRRSKLSRR